MAGQRLNAPRDIVAIPRLLAAWGGIEAGESDPNALVQETCVGCHNDAALIGNLSLETFDVAHAEKNSPVAEKVIRKLRAGMMPPPEVPRPDQAALDALV